MAAKSLEVLVGKPLSRIGRAADVLWLQFGYMKAIPTRRGVKWVGEWALHVQTSWRFVRISKVILAIADLYRAPDGNGYDWGTGGDSYFDNYTERFNTSLSDSPLVVNHVAFDDIGGFKISLSGDTRFDVFTKDSGAFESIELWRLFQPNSNFEHTVCEIRDGKLEIG